MSAGGEGPRLVYAVCGPTASGKSGVADRLVGRLDERLKERLDAGPPARTLVIDSMQVYAEIPHITNQARDRKAELVGIRSVTRPWSVAMHRAAFDDLISCDDGGGTVIDAGTGMYLNAALLDLPIAPRVDDAVRGAVVREMRSSPPPRGTNPRREARRRELLAAGERPPGTVWRGDLLRFPLAMVYLRPARHAIDEAIAHRTRRIASEEGLAEAAVLLDLARAGTPPTQQVMSSIGARELVGVVEGRLTIKEASDGISARTRRLARQQVRWFDKLARTLSSNPRACVRVAQGPRDPAASPGAFADLGLCMQDLYA